MFVLLLYNKHTYSTFSGRLQIRPGIHQGVFTTHARLGALQSRKNSKNLTFLWKWVSESRSHSEFFLVGKSSQNSSKPVLIFWNSIPCVFCLYIYTLLIVVDYDDLSVPSVSLMGFQKKKFGRGVGGWGELCKCFFDFFNFANPLSPCLAKSPCCFSQFS